ncbi:MAG TPA: hypothetical protein VFZ53_09465 [Polyangiaceae bacterium]
MAFVVGLTVIAAALAAPRATEPDVLPLPLPDRSVLGRVKAASEARAEEARSRGLSYDVRAVGEAIRRCGAATIEGQGVPDAAIGEVRMAVKRALDLRSERGLVGLLALQTELFVAATHAFEKSGKQGGALRELGELGGDFVAMANQNGWLERGRFVLDDDERAALFRVRWTELTGLREKAEFAPTLDEYRAYYTLYLRKLDGASRDRSERAFAVVRALEKRDPAYPGTFARGVLYYRAGLFQEAAEAFSAHLARHPDGPWTLRAKNHVLAALAHGASAD